MHGCTGLWTGFGSDTISARDSDWSTRLVAAGYAVFMPDSFRPRGFSEHCNERDGILTPRRRAQDAFGAGDWLARQRFVATGRIGLLGWSHGGSTALYAANDAAAAVTDGFAVVIAFYPSCQAILNRGWSARKPTTILHGLADDWKPAAPCEELAKLGGARFIGFAGAYHDFDYPNLALREQKAAYSQRRDGMVTIGTDSEARMQAIAAVIAILRAM
jgi:dienelactone hydrolase